MIYLDNAATTYPKPEGVYNALDYANRNLSFNAGRGEYPEAIKAFSSIQTARERVASFVDANPQKVVFTSSATEALNMIIGGLEFSPGETVYISPFEHNAIVRPLKALEQKGLGVAVIPFDRETWKPDLNALRDQFALRPPKAIFLSQVSNVTGYKLPFELLFALAKEYSAVTILDCAQAYGIVPLRQDNIDYVVFAGHKSLYGPFGVGGFILLSNHEIAPTKFGGTGSDSLNPSMPTDAPGKYEAGSPNVVAIAGLIESINWLKKQDIYEHEKKLTIYAIEQLSKIEKVKLFLPADITNIIGIVSFAVEGYSPEDVGSILSSEYNILLRTGYHCAPLVHDFIGSRKCGGTVRASLSAFTSSEDIDALVAAIKTL